MLISDIIPYERNARRNERAIPKVAESIKEFGLQDKIFICGVDGDPDVYALMKADGENCNYICTMAQDPDTMARTCVRGVVDLLNGKTLDSKVEYIPGIKVTPANVNEIG